MNSSHPHSPAFARFILRWSVSEPDADSVVDDLEEIYREILEEDGPRRANAWYWRQVVRSVPVFLALSLSWSLVMLNNYLRVALRSLNKQKGLSFINIVSLAIGIAFCALIFLFVRDEVTFDRFHEKKDRIFLAETVWYDAEGNEDGFASNGPAPLGPALADEIPEVEAFVRTRDMEHYARSGGEAIMEPVLYADPSLLTVFTFPLLEGDPETALVDRDAVVITRDTAIKFFGTPNALGRVLQVRLDETYRDFTVGGVAENVPANSTIDFDILLPFELVFETAGWKRYADIHKSWTFAAIQNYVLLDENASAAQAEELMPAFVAQHFPADEDAGQVVERSLRFRPITEVHLALWSSASYSYILSGIALGILLIACINFMTLSIGRSSARSREVSIRKVVGAQRRQLVWQFWGESLLLSFVALILGAALAQYLLPVFNSLTGKELSFNYIRDWSTVAGLGAIVLVAGILGGSYPAAVLSGFRPVEALRSRTRLGGSNLFTKTLVVGQFSLSVFLIVGTLVMHRQLDYAKNQDPGFNSDHVVIMPVNGTDVVALANRFRTAMGNQPLIQDITATGNTLGNSSTHGTFYEYGGRRHVINVFRVETNYLDFLDLDLLQGRNFSPSLATDSTQSIIVNETLVRDFELEDPVGKPVPGFDDENNPVIIGVVKDYHAQSLYRELWPVVLTMNTVWDNRFLLARISPNNVPESMTLLESTWNRFMENVPFEGTFLDEHMQSMYEDDTRWSRIIGYASLMAIAIACLGLIGLSSLTTRARYKEIGIRKVLGAGVAGVSFLLSRQFLVLVLIAVGVATPVSYVVMQNWLEDFAYRVDLSVDIFALAGALALLLALSTVSYQSIRAALADPVKSIQSDG